MSKFVSKPVRQFHGLVYVVEVNESVEQNGFVIGTLRHAHVVQDSVGFYIDRMQGMVFNPTYFASLDEAVAAV